MHGPPRSEDVEIAITRLLVDVSGHGIDLDTELDTLGLSSIAIQRIVTHLEDEWQLRVPMLLLFESDTVSDLISAARSAIDRGEFAEARPAITRLSRARPGY